MTGDELLDVITCISLKLIINLVRLKVVLVDVHVLKEVLQVAAITVNLQLSVRVDELSG